MTPLHKTCLKFIIFINFIPKNSNNYNTTIDSQSYIRHLTTCDIKKLQLAMLRHKLLTIQLSRLFYLFLKQIKTHIRRTSIYSRLSIFIKARALATPYIHFHHLYLNTYSFISGKGTGLSILLRFDTNTILLKTALLEDKSTILVMGGI